MGDIPRPQNDGLDVPIASLKPVFPPMQTHSPESPSVETIIDTLSLIPHIEGGYYAVTSLSTLSVPSPYPPVTLSEKTVALVGGLRADFDVAVRNMYSTIFYYLSPIRPLGSFHRNRSRIVHSLHSGRGRYVLIHPNGRLESFIVGQDVQRGERIQWVVDGGVWKASYLLGPSSETSDSSAGAKGDTEGLLITETVVPAFEYADHEFLTREKCLELLPVETVAELEWMIKH